VIGNPAATSVTTPLNNSSSSSSSDHDNAEDEPRLLDMEDLPVIDSSDDERTTAALETISNMSIEVISRPSSSSTGTFEPNTLTKLITKRNVSNKPKLILHYHKKDSTPPTSLNKEKLKETEDRDDNAGTSSKSSVSDAAAGMVFLYHFLNNF
jgi:hypothetical protein